MIVSSCSRRIGSVHWLWTLTAAVWSSPAGANCGLDMCPMHSVEEGEHSPVHLQVQLRLTSVESGSGYVETLVGTRVAVQDRLHLGVHIPVVRVQEQATTHAGLGNVVLFGSWSAVEPGSDAVVDLGLQLETPTVTDPVLGDGHFLLLPTVQAGWHPGSGILMGVLGWGQVLDGDHHHHAASSIVNPHANSEILLRLDAGRSWEVANKNVRSTLRADGVQALGHHDETESVLNLGPAVGLVGQRVTGELYGLVPVTQARRYEFRSGLRLSLQWP